jgi:mannose-6-phosphate isomerase class I
MAIVVKHVERSVDILEKLEPQVAQIFVYNFKQNYLPGAPVIKLLVVAIVDDAEYKNIRLLVTEASTKSRRILERNNVTGDTLADLAVAWQTPVIDLSQPLMLEPVAIAKPWGREVWYTAIEERGLSRVGDGRFSMPLAWLVDIAPNHLLGLADQQPNLLKILDPLSQPVYGDLYFELHEKKREVYVVTYIDKQVWPDGVGGIRYGFSPVQRSKFGGDKEFRAAYLTAVTNYRELRIQIDNQIDQMREDEGIGLNEPVSPELAQRWQEKIPVAIRNTELSLRENMERFTHIKPLRVGDVVKIPLLTPHALLHGVRTVEFQTPVYERKILSFAQKVLTQAEWDTEDAVKLMSLDVAPDDELSIIEDGPVVRREQMVSFPDFEVERITFKSVGTWRLPDTRFYSLLMTIAGQLTIHDYRVMPEEAMIVPAVSKNMRLENLSSAPCVVLVARPS